MTKQNSFKLKNKIICLALLLVQFPLLAETVILRSHEVVHGKITYQDALVLRMNDDLGKPLELQKNDILKVSYRDVKDAKEIKRIIDEEESKLPPEKRKKKIVVVVPENRYTLFLRSAAIPGWGQWKAGNKWYAAAAFVGVVGAAGYATTSFQGFKSSEKDYNSKSFLTVALLSQIPEKDFSSTNKILYAALSSARNYGPYANASTIGNNAIQGLAIVYAIQLMHSFYLGYKWEKANPNANTTIGKKAAFGDWNFNASPRQAYAPTPTGVNRETYYEMNYEFRF